MSFQVPTGENYPPIRF